MDPFSLTVGAVGLLVPALHATRILLNDISEWKKAPRSVKDLKGEIDLVEAAVESLKGIEDADWNLMSPGVKDQTESIVKTTTKSCELFTADLKHWTRHSQNGELKWRDKATIGFFKRNQVVSMTKQLENCKLSIIGTVSIATL